jgi:phage terminase small subunit
VDGTDLAVIPVATIDGDVMRQSDGRLMPGHAGLRVKNGPLVPKQQRFVDEYVLDFAPKAAAVRSGYSSKSAECIAGRLLKDPRVIALVEAKKAEIARRNDVTVWYVVQGLKQIVDFDKRQLFRPDGSMKLPHELDDAAMSGVASIRTKIIPSRDPNVPDRVVTTEIEPSDKLKALDMLARYLKMYTDDGGLQPSVTIKIEGGFGGI